MKLYRARGELFYHWCPGCQKVHPLPAGWTFNGDVERPTFSPSFFQERGTPEACHYIITDGVIEYAGGCEAHTFEGQRVPMPDVPDAEVARLDRVYRGEGS